MNVDKLLKAIQILVKEEVKKQLPTIVKEVVKREVSNLLNERTVDTPNKKINSKLSHSKTLVETDINSVSKKNKPIQLTKNPILNEVLSQTRPFTKNERDGSPAISSVLDKYESQITEGYEGMVDDGGFEEWPTMSNPLTNLTHTTTTPVFDRAELAAKMGYGDISAGPSPNGLGIKTGLAGLDRVLNRDNRELIKAMDKNKNFRPGM
jgi:hypothetical protein